MAETIGKALLPTYFKSAWEALRPGGVFLNHYIGFHSYMPVARLDFVHRYVVPDCDLLPIGTTCELPRQPASRCGMWKISRITMLTTLRHWIRRLEERAVEAKQIASETTYRIWRLHLAMGLRGFVDGPLNLYQTLLVKSERGGKGLPLRRDDWYA